jgi:hypothetical protein
MHSEGILACFTDIIAAVDLIQRWIAEAGGIDESILMPRTVPRR